MARELVTYDDDQDPRVDLRRVCVGCPTASKHEVESVSKWKS